MTMMNPTTVVWSGVLATQAGLDQAATNQDLIRTPEDLADFERAFIPLLDCLGAQKVDPVVLTRLSSEVLHLRTSVRDAVVRKDLPLKKIGKTLRKDVPSELYAKAVQSVRAFGSGLCFGTAPQAREAIQKTLRIGEQSRGELDAALYEHIDDLQLSARLARSLDRVDLRYVGEIVQKTENNFFKPRRVGTHLLRELKGALSEMGLMLGMPIDGFSRDEADRRRITKALTLVEGSLDDAARHLQMSREELRREIERLSISGGHIT